MLLVLLPLDPSYTVRSTHSNIFTGMSIWALGSMLSIMLVCLLKFHFVSPILLINVLEIIYNRTFRFLIFFSNHLIARSYVPTMHNWYRKETCVLRIQSPVNNENTLFRKFWLKNLNNLFHDLNIRLGLMLKP